MTCNRHPERPAEALCAECEKLFCWACMAFDTTSQNLVCSNCAGILDRRTRHRRLIRFARNPALYIFLIVTISLAAYLNGVGRQSPASLQQEDQDSPWFRQRAPRLWLQAAYRAKERARYLESQGDIRGKEHWAKLAARSFANAKECWKGGEPEFDVAGGEALMVARSGPLEDGYRKLVSLAGVIPESHPSYLPYVFHRANLAWETRHKAEAVKDWTTILKKTAGADAFMSASDMIGDIVDLFSGGMHQATVILQVRQVCETLVVDREMREAVEQAVREYGLKPQLPGDVAATLDDPQGSSGTVRGTSTTQNGILIRHFEEAE
ncbi:MAG: B-box zinc finger protein [Candidatus Pacebacteria bacterium]|nr:B-box zinc finger protein [Candidatus Paceibacterota bacterium]